MKKRHLIRLILTCIIGFSVFFTMICDVFRGLMSIKWTPKVRLYAAQAE